MQRNKYFKTKIMENRLSDMEWIERYVEKRLSIDEKKWLDERMAAVADHAAARPRDVKLEDGEQAVRPRQRARHQVAEAELADRVAEPCDRLDDVRMVAGDRVEAGAGERVRVRDGGGARKMLELPLPVWRRDERVECEPLARGAPVGTDHVVRA